MKNIENIEVPSPQSNYIVRQDRKDLTLGEVFLEIKDNLYPLDNLSLSGLSIKVDNNITFSKNLLTASLILKNQKLQEVRLKPIREYTKNGHHFIAFEIIDSSIDLEQIDLIHKINAILSKNLTIIEAKEINENFKNLTLELYYFLKNLEEDINQFQIENFLFSREEIEQYENKIIESTTNHLKNYILKFLNNLENKIAHLSEEEKKQHYSYFRQICGNFFDQSYLAYRAYHKLPGYAGDHQTIQLIYDNKPRGKTLFAKCMDNFFLSALESEAVRNRSKYLEKKIKHFIKQNNRAKIVSFGCGTAQEIRNLLLNQPSLLKDSEIHLIDQDVEALKNAQKLIKKILTEKQTNSNIYYHNWGIKNILKNGFTFGKADFIYSAGVYDYLSDKVCYKLTSTFFDLLNSNGMIIIGNFNTNTPEHLVRTIILDWNLNLRDKKKLLELFSPIGKLKIESEPLNINLFVNIFK
jgi:extracellular factor (EF) 3-hydroxypalmitic acid methyl ester biosynthesis protein